MKNYGLLMDWDDWFSAGGCDRQLRAPPDIWVGAIAPLTAKPIGKLSSQAIGNGRAIIKFI
jgi:hypothetical protein